MSSLYEEDLGPVETVVRETDVMLNLPTKLKMRM